MENSKNSSATAEEKAKEDQELFLTQLPKVKICTGFDLFQYQAFWCPSIAINGVISFQKHFQAEESDIILVPYRKSGTAWLKTLTFSIVNRSRYAIENSPLLTPLIILYLSNPLDQFISEWQFIARRNNSHLDLDEAFERTCKGIQSFGPFWDHVLGYWKANKEQSDKILFLKYEDLKEDGTFYIKRMADFLGCPFSEDEVTQGVVQEIAKLCSLDNIKNLEVIKSGSVNATGTKNSLFLRKGEVGDWKNYLTPSMSQRLQKIVEEKFVGSGLTFKTSLEEPQK
ncbi:cytosolic sulfotransferase 15 [Citrus sinensis]|nr:cytosolic sulfotransferase 15 [Citrus sinensis]